MKHQTSFCDLSSHNANVFLELGWALRADKSFILIKDDLTEHTFDLSQQFTYEYQHSLKPITLRKESEELSQAIWQTIEDPEKRFSVVRRLSLSASAIKASRAGDLQVRLLADIQRSLAAIQEASIIREPKQQVDFPWPNLLSKTTACTQAFGELFESAGGIPPLEGMNGLAERLGIVHSREVQVSVIGSDRRWVFHDWNHLIGGPVGIPGAESHRIIEEMFLRSYGAVAWTDRVSNVKREYKSPRYKRFTIGVYFLHFLTGCRIFAEAHHEIE